MTEPLYLPTVTMVAITDSDVGKTVEALLRSLKHVRPARTIFFSNVYVERPEFECIVIEPFGSASKYNQWVMWQLGKYIEEGHILLVQHDGYVLDADAWTDDFLQYDYIGAPWHYTDGRNVGNGGFSLRSARLHHVLATDPVIDIGEPEDEVICRFYRKYLEKNHGIKYAPDTLAHRFSFEMHKPLQKTFGFHNYFNEPYKEPIVIHRSGAMGDVIMAEPVLAHFAELGYRVILDTAPNPHYKQLFMMHPYKVEHSQDLKEDYRSYRTINLDMAYEVQPKQLVLKSYFEAAGVKHYKLRNSQFNFNGAIKGKLFPKYVIMHNNITDMPHRNTYYFNWPWLVSRLEARGYMCVEIGHSGLLDRRYQIMADDLFMLGYIIGNADFFIGSDSGPAHIAVAAGVPAAIFFGSVNPVLRYPSMNNIFPIQPKCPVKKDGCYHNAISVRGIPCEVNADMPPCCNYARETQEEDILQLLP